MADQTVYEATANTIAEYAQMMQDGFAALAAATDYLYDYVSGWEYFATWRDGSKEYRAYAHLGTDLYVAKLVDRSS